MKEVKAGDKAKERCPKCGKSMAGNRRPGSLTSYLFGALDCSCSTGASATNRSTSSKRLDDDAIDFCPKCGLKIVANSKDGSMTGFLFQSTRCKCPPDQAFADGKMSAKFWKLKLAGSGTIFTSADSAAGEASRATSSAIDLLPGAMIGGVYQIIKLLGRGGMGEVYLARHETLGKKCALKVIPPEQVTEVGWQRFQLEAKAVAKLDHINLVRVTDLGIHEGCLPYYAMGYAEGQNLAELLADHGPMPLETVLEIFVQVCDGVECAHRSGILHRDLKPANIMVITTKAGAKQAKVLDFGLAKLTTHDRTKQSLTAVGDIFGSPFYMSPEQCNGDKLDNRSDIYSLGCTMFECLTGQPPFGGHLAAAVIFSHLEADPPALESVVGHSAFPEAVEVVMAKILRKNPVERYQTLSELRGDLEKVARGESVLPFYMSRSTQPHAELSERGPYINQARLRPSSVGVNRFPLSVLVGLGAVGLTSVLAFIAVCCFFAFYVRAPGGPSRPPTPSATLGNTAGTTPGQSSQIVRYQQNPDASNLDWRIYNFPSDVSLGTLYWYPAHRAKNVPPCPKNLKAMGKVMVPPRTILELTASEALSKQPELFGGFGANDLTQLILNPALSWSNKHVACISNLTGLSGLTINEADITDGCIADLNKLAHLNDLSANFTGITGAGFAQLRRLPQLRMFTAAGTNTLSVALQKMTGCQSVGSLQANQCNLTDKDMQVIGNMSNLEGLYVSENIHITDDGVRSICQLRTLHMLDLSQTAVTPLCINMLKKLPKLRWLGISTQKWSKADQLRIKHNLPVAVDVAPESNEIDESLK